jgi:hypothetical protein
MQQIIFSVLTGMFAWWVIYHGFRPRIKWEHYVEERSSGYAWHPAPQYSIAFVNSGFRSAVEINTHARLRIRGAVPGKPSRWLVIEVPTNNELIPISPSTQRFTHWRFWERPQPIRRVIVLHFDELGEGDLRRLPRDLANRVKEGGAGLRDLMALGTESDLTMAAICSDSFSGARRAALSIAFRSINIRQVPGAPTTPTY